MPKARVNGIDMYYEDHGVDADPVVLIQGLGANRTFWEPNLPALVERHRILLLDYRGSGDTDRPAGTYSTKQFADDIAALMDTVGFPKAHVVGRSMGGCIAQWMGIAHPDKVRSLILAATWGRADGMLRRTLESWANLLEKAGVEALFEQAFLWCYTRDFFEPRHAAALKALDTLVRGHRPPPDAFRRQSRAGQEHDALDRLGSIAAPTLVLVGEEDILTPPRFSKELAERIPDGTLRVLERLGHAFYEQEPEVFNQAAEEFWSRN